ncbi:MAG: GH12 family glycosyl hydrolase domain-containing protein [Jiangellaceae bacterium]
MLTGSAAHISDPSGAVSFGNGTHMVACAGREMVVTGGGASDIDVLCEYGVRRMGAAQTFVAAETGKASTALPAGTTSGTLLISSVHTSASSTVSMKGWTKAYDSVNSTRGLRLATWWRVAVPGEAAPVATLSAPARVSMMTLAFTGIDPQAPLLSAATATGLTAPAGPGVDGGVWLHSLGAQRRPRVTPPDGATGVGTLTNGNMKTAQAVSTSESGVTPPSTWSGRRVRAAVAGLLSVGPAPEATIPPGATAVAAGERMDVSCAPLALEYEAVSATVVSVTCTEEESASPTATSSPTATPTRTRTTTPTPASPAGTPTPSASPSSPSPPPPPPPSGTCTDGITISEGAGRSFSDGSGGEYYVHNNNWNDTAGGNSVITACDYNSWSLVSDIPDHSDLSVQTYPNVHRDYNDIPLSQITSARFGATGPHCAGCIWNIAFDIWIGDGFSHELMIWTENWNQRPAGNVVGTTTIGGQQYQVWRSGSGDGGIITYLSVTPQTSGTMPLALFFADVRARGWTPTTTWQVDYGVEVVDTNGKPERFDFTDFSITD